MDADENGKDKDYRRDYGGEKERWYGGDTKRLTVKASNRQSGYRESGCRESGYC